MQALAVTVVGEDRPGIIAAVTAALAGLGGNLEDSSMTLLRGHFAMTLVVRTATDAGTVRRTLEPVAADLGLTVAVAEVSEEAAPGGEGTPFLLRVHGADRPGIVAAVTEVVARHGGNITEATTRLAGELYVLAAEIDLPTSADVVVLARDLQRVAGEVGVHADLVPVDDGDAVL